MPDEAGGISDEVLVELNGEPLADETSEEK
jgi:hypothetical protein